MSKFKYGYIAPNGDFIKKTKKQVSTKYPDDLEKLGYVKIFSRVKPYFWFYKTPTKEQYDTLCNLGFFEVMGTWEDIYHFYNFVLEDTYKSNINN